MPSLSPFEGKFDFGEVAVEPAGPLLAQSVRHFVQHHLAGRSAVQFPQRPCVEMSKIHTREQPLVQSAQLQHLVQISQLVDLAHRLRTEDEIAIPLLVAGVQNRLQRGLGDFHRLSPGPLHQGAGVDDDALCPHPLCRLTGGGDVADVLVQRHRVRVGQADKIGGVNGEGDAALPGLFSQKPGGLLLHPDPSAALVFVVIQADFGKPRRGVQAGLADGVRKGVGIARHAESRAHSSPS